MPEQAFVISDLHMGAGLEDPLEDFYDDDVLADWLDGLPGLGTTLIVNGDFVDFAQIEPLSVNGLPSDLLWDEDASLAKLETALGAHSQGFDGLGSFLSRGGALRVTVGNHDLDFAWSRVQQRFRAAVGAEDGQVQFTIGAEQYAGVHVEHGYQFTPENCPRDAARFIHEFGEGSDRRLYLERVWGTDFLLRFFNDLERSNPFADNVKPTILVAYHGLRKGWLPKRALVQIAVFLKRRGVPWRALVSVTLDDDDPAPTDLAEAFEEESWRDLANEALATDDGELVRAIAELPPGDRKVLIHHPPVRIGAEESLLDDDAETLGLVRDSREERAARDRLTNMGVTSVVFGHTHRIVDGALDGTLFNPGTWIPHLDLRSEYVRAKLRSHGISLDVLNDRSLYEVRRRAVWIRPDRHRATIELLDCT